MEKWCVRGRDQIICYAGRIFDGYATHSATSLHGSSWLMVCNPLASPVLPKFVFQAKFQGSRYSPLMALFSQRRPFICHLALSYSWAYSLQVPVSLARYYGRSYNVASVSRPFVCSYYLSSPPASFRYTASSGCSHRVEHNGIG